MADDVDAPRGSDDAPGRDQAPKQADRERKEKTADPEAAEEKTQEKPERESISEGIKNPLRDVLGGTDGWGAAQAHRTGRRTLRASGWSAAPPGAEDGASVGATVGGIGAVAPVTGGSHNRINIGDTVINMRPQRELGPGPVRPQVLKEIRECYSPVAGYDELVRRLMTDRLLVLRGTPGTGRGTTGLRLLDEVADGSVSRFAPETDLREVGADDLTMGTGYLYELPPHGPTMTEVHLDRLKGLLDERGCRLVIVAPHDSRYGTALDGYAVACPAPEPGALLDRLLAWEGRAQPDLASRLEAVSRNPDLKPVRDAIRLPAEARSLAALLVLHAKDEIGPAEVARRSEDSLSQHIADWFRPLATLPPGAEGDEQVRRVAFRIALAVFDEAPFHLVAEAGELMTWEILLAGSPRRTPGRPVFADARGDDVANSRARLYPGATELGETSVPATFVAYDDDRMPAAVLHHAWGIHNLRGPLIRWLRLLSQDTRPFVWVRAALAIGVLCAWDFTYTYHELIAPWAMTPDEVPDYLRRRLVAAIALDHASHDDDVLPAVRAVVDGWCEDDDIARRWTGATVLGYGLGLRDFAKAVKALRNVGCWDVDDDGRQPLATVASWAMAEMFCRGGVEPVAETVVRWLADDRTDVRFLGTLTGIRLAALGVRDVEDLELLTEAGRGRWTRLAERRDWPLLAALADEDPTLREPFADAVWAVTQVARANEVTLNVLTGWARAAAKDRTSVVAVSRLMALLGDSDTDRARLLHLIHELRHDRDDPLPSDVADRLVYAVTMGVPREDDVPREDSMAEMKEGA